MIFWARGNVKGSLTPLLLILESSNYAKQIKKDTKTAFGRFILREVRTLNIGNFEKDAGMRLIPSRTAVIWNQYLDEICNGSFVFSIHLNEPPPPSHTLIQLILTPSLPHTLTPTHPSAYPPPLIGLVFSSPQPSNLKPVAIMRKSGLI